MWFEANHNIVSTRKDADWKAVRRGTVQHEIFEDQKAVPLADGEVMNIKVNCKNDAGKIASPVPYGIVVTLEVGEGVNIAVYDEVRARILTSVRVQSGDEV